MKLRLYLLLTVLAISCLILKAGIKDEELKRAGYIDVTTIDESIVVDLMYARPDNFVGEIMYRPEELSKAWLHPDAAAALGRASRMLKRERPDLRFKVCDATRPMSVQRKMYRVVRGTSKAPYVSNPANGGGLHNYGLAVDITLCDSLGRELPMGTPVDFLGKEANIDCEEQLLRAGKLTHDELANRRLLRRIMRESGFKTIRTEWWHFNLMSRNQARKKYKPVE